MIPSIFNLAFLTLATAVVAVVILAWPGKGRRWPWRLRLFFGVAAVLMAAKGLALIAQALWPRG